MQLRQLYTVRFFYPDGRDVKLKDSSEPNSSTTQEEHFYFTQCNCERSITGEFRGANHPHRRVDKSFAMKLQGFIKTDDGALIMTDYRGYGRSLQRSQQLYGAGLNEKQNDAANLQVRVTYSDKYRWLNDTMCAIAREVRAPIDVPPEKVRQEDVKLVFTVAEIVWEPPPE